MLFRRARQSARRRLCQFQAAAHICGPAAEVQSWWQGWLPLWLCVLLAMHITLQVRTAGSAAPLKTTLMSVQPEANFLAVYAAPLVSATDKDLAILHVVACQTLEALERAHGIEIDLATLRSLTCSNIMEVTDCKYYSVLCASNHAPPQPVPAPLPGSLHEMLKQGAQKQAALQLPAPSKGTSYNHVIRDLLVRRLKADELGVGGGVQLASMEALLDAVAKALLYLLPFEQAVSDAAPQGQLHARRVQLPARLTTEGLKIKAFHHGHHEKINDGNADTRLSRVTLEELVDNIARKLSTCHWIGKSKSMWQKGKGAQFLADINELTSTMTKKALSMMVNVEQVTAPLAPPCTHATSTTSTSTSTPNPNPHPNPQPSPSPSPSPPPPPPPRPRRRRPRRRRRRHCPS